MSETPTTAPSGEERDLLRYEMTAQLPGTPLLSLAKLQAELRATWEIIRQKERDAYQESNALDVQQLDALNTQLALENAALASRLSALHTELERTRVEAKDRTGDVLRLRGELGRTRGTLEAIARIATRDPHEMPAHDMDQIRQLALIALGSPDATTRREG